MVREETRCWRLALDGARKTSLAEVISPRAVASFSSPLASILNFTLALSSAEDGCEFDIMQTLYDSRSSAAPAAVTMSASPSSIEVRDTPVKFTIACVVRF